jgi:hypothetical protein
LKNDELKAAKREIDKIKESDLAFPQFLTLKHIRLDLESLRLFNKNNHDEKITIPYQQFADFVVQLEEFLIHYVAMKTIFSPTGIWEDAPAYYLQLTDGQIYNLDNAKNKTRTTLIRHYKKICDDLEIPLRLKTIDLIGTSLGFSGKEKNFTMPDQLQFQYNVIKNAMPRLDKSERKYLNNIERFREDW